MLKSQEDISATKKRLKIEIPAETLESEIQKALAEVQRKTKIPGFRPGKAPMGIIEKRFGKNVEADVLERIIPEYYLKAIQEGELRPVSSPVVEESFDFKRNAPLSLTVTLEVRPDIPSLSYESLAVKDVAVEVKDDDVEQVLRGIAEERATFEPADDAVQQGDLITLDYVTPEVETPVRDVVVKVGSGPYPEEFHAGLIGHKKEDEFQIEATFPQDSPLPFAGKKQAVTITVKDIKRRNIPAVDDEFAKDLGHDTLSELREHIRGRLISSRSREADRTKQKEILDRLIASHDFEVPESLMNAELGRIVNEIMASGKDERSEEVLRGEFNPAVEKSIRGSILLEIIGEKEGVTVTEEDIKHEILGIAQAYQMPPENVVKFYTARDGSLDRLRRTIFERKVLAFLLSKAKIEEGAPA